MLRRFRDDAPIRPLPFEAGLRISTCTDFFRGTLSGPVAMRLRVGGSWSIVETTLLSRGRIGGLIDVVVATPIFDDHTNSTYLVGVHAANWASQRCHVDSAIFGCRHTP